MAFVGAFARIDPDDAEQVRSRLERLSGVEIFDLGDPLKLGLFIEADTVELAHEILTREIPNLEGVLGAWPVFLHGEEEFKETPPAPQGGA